MALWHKLRRIASAAKVKTKKIFDKLSSNRPIILRSTFSKNFITILISLFYKRDRLKPAVCKQTQMIADMYIPKMFRQSIFKAYSKFYKVILHQIQLPLKQYSTFSAFFTRKITRPLPIEAPSCVSSPCDGKILTIQQVTQDKCHIIKNVTYSLTELVSGVAQQSKTYINDNLKLNKKNKLYQIIIYLAPGDYHRFHAPVDLSIIKTQRIQGRCDSVSEKTILKDKHVYQKNGRAVVTSKWNQGLMTLVMVGALNVMRINITEQTKLKRGDQLGYFNLGSTIIMIVEAKDLQKWMIEAGQKIKVGEPLLLYKNY